MLAVIVALYVISALLPLLGLAGLFFESQRELQERRRVIEARGRDELTTGDLSMHFATLPGSWLRRRNERLRDFILIGVGIVLAATASILSLFSGP